MLGIKPRQLRALTCLSSPPVIGGPSRHSLRREHLVLSEFEHGPSACVELSLCPLNWDVQFGRKGQRVIPSQSNQTAGGIFSTPIGTLSTTRSEPQVQSRDEQCFVTEFKGTGMISSITAMTCELSIMSHTRYGQVSGGGERCQ